MMALPARLVPDAFIAHAEEFFLEDDIISGMQINALWPSGNGLDISLWLGARSRLGIFVDPH